MGKKGFSSVVELRSLIRRLCVRSSDRVRDEDEAILGCSRNFG